MSTIVVTNISPLLEEKHLAEIFEVCGPIAKIELLEGVGGLGQRVCIIQFKEPAHAEAALMLNGTPLGDRALEVKIKPQSGSSSESVKAAQSLLSLGLPSLLPTLNPLVLATIANVAQSLQAPSPTPITPQYSNAALEAARRRQDEIARTVYVGNLSYNATEKQIETFFQQAGTVLYVKIAGENPGTMTKYGFVEFADVAQANQAYNLNGGLIAGIPCKVGKANNPIVKNSKGMNDPEKIRQALEKVAAATKKIEQKVIPKEKSKSRSRSRSGKRKKKRSRSSRRSRSRGKKKDRDRSRSRDRRKKKGGKRSRSRSRHRRRSRSRSRSPPKEKPKKPNPHEGMFWDGYQWIPIPDLPPAKQIAALLAQQQKANAAKTEP